MAGLIKNQILKHLTKFAKNLKAADISVDVLKGKGHLDKVELNEEVLTAVLELPGFLHVRKATALRIGVRVPWTRLKSQPIQLFIDEIICEVEMSSELRKPKSGMASSALSALSTDNSYGFVNRVAEGLSLYINTLDVSFSSASFAGSLMLSRLAVESVTPSWQKAADLRQTRIADSGLAQCLLFKQVTWQLLRIEASATESRVEGKGPPISAPLRLITSQGRSRLQIKKSTADGSVLAGRIQVLLEQILWVATLPQIKSAIAFYKELSALMKAAQDAEKLQQAQRILQQQQNGSANPAPSSQPSTPSKAPSVDGKVSSSRAFAALDVPQTSYHFYLTQVDLHLCEDASAGTKFPEDWPIENGALQVSLRRLEADLYPCHVASSDRASWVRYRAPDCRDWTRRLLKHYHNLLAVKLSIRDRAVLEREWGRLMSSSVVVKVGDLLVNSVSEASTRREDMGRLISADETGKKDATASPLPDSAPLIHAEFTDHYHASTQPNLPTPPSVTQVILSPLRVELDLRTLRWLHYVGLDVFKALDLDEETLSHSPPHVDIRLEALMPKLLLPSPGGAAQRQPKRPSALCLQVRPWTSTRRPSATARPTWTSVWRP